MRTTSLHQVLLVAAAVCFLLSAVSVSHPRINAVALGLLCWVLTLLV